MIKIQALKDADLTGIGQAYFVREGRTPDGQDDIQTYFGKIAILKEAGDFQLGVCIAKNRPYIVDKLECHLQTPEYLVALKGSFVVPCAPSVNGVPDTANAKAVRVEQGEGIVFDPGVWHWTPYAITPECNVLVCFKEDTPSKDFNAFELENPWELG